MVSVKTQTLGPKVATVASGHKDEAGAAGLAVTVLVELAALAAGIATPAPAVSAAARITAERRSLRVAVPVTARRRGPLADRTRAGPNLLV
jgi:hypothetical protein